jgi:cell division protein ZipA
LPGPKDSLTVFSEMLSTAERLAKLLQGEVLDQRRQPLTRQSIEEMREEVLEHRRLVRLSRIKR